MQTYEIIILDIQLFQSNVANQNNNNSNKLNGTLTLKDHKSSYVGELAKLLIISSWSHKK